MSGPGDSGDTDDFRSLVVPRFLRYVRVCTASDRHVEETPSTPGQWELARLLAEELRALGLAEVEVTGHCYVLARLPENLPGPSPGPNKDGPENPAGAPAIGLLAHLDTAQDVSGQDVKPVLVEHYDGKKITLNGGAVLDPAADPDLAAQRGRAIIHTDGSTLLGADDKAGIAEIMGAVEYLLSHPEIRRGPVIIIFSPDEETGKGLPHFPLERITEMAGGATAEGALAGGGLAACYTLDGGPLGELEAECFNAIEAKVRFTGRVIHLGQARGELANACLMAAVFAAMLPRTESPEATDGRYGYYCPTAISGGLERAELEVYIRDFDIDTARRRAAALDAFARAVEAQFPGGAVEVEVRDQYYNMREKIAARPEVLAKLEEAARRRGIAFTRKPIRGGTDGSRLTELGIPTPNIFAGGRNFHSVTEWAAVSDMEAACGLAVELVRVWGE